MIKISSIIIARDEEANIARCIKSQLSCIDQINVIIDSRTKDNTTEIVKSFNVDYRIADWEGYAATKQKALEIASNDWILWIDADEALTPELCDEINEFKKNIPEFAAYTIPRKANFLGRWIKHSGWYPGRVTRLFDKSKACFSEKDIHEHLIIKGETGMLLNDLEHWTDPTIEHYFAKFNVYTTLAAGELFEQKRRVTWLGLLFRPVLMFIKMYFFKLGFLDGIHGFILAVFSSNYVFTKYSKLKELYRELKK